MTERLAPTIAVVDDDDDSLMLAAAVLTGAGLRVITDDGAPGVAGRLVDPMPSLILLDLHLEGRTAENVLAELRQQERLRGVPILGFTAALPGDPLLERVQPYLAGHVRKPIDPGELSTAIAHALGPDRTTLPRAEPPDPAIADAHRRFRDGLSARIDRIEDALADADTDRLVHEIHQLRGAAAGFGFNDIAQAAASAETALRARIVDAAAAVARLIAVARAWD